MSNQLKVNPYPTYETVFEVTIPDISQHQNHLLNNVRFQNEVPVFNSYLSHLRKYMNWFVMIFSVKFKLHFKLFELLHQLLWYRECYADLARPVVNFTHRMCMYLPTPRTYLDPADKNQTNQRKQRWYQIIFYAPINEVVPFYNLIMTTVLFSGPF